MPGGVVDGALIVDTKIDNSGSRRGADEFRRQVDGLRNAANQAGRDMANGANGYIRAMNRGRAAAKGATADQAALAKEISNTEAALKRLEARQELARRKFEAAREAAEEKAAEEFSANNAGAELLPWEDEMQAAEQMAEALNERIREVSDAFGQFEDSAAFRNTNVEIQMLTEKLEAMKAQLAGMRQAQGDGAAVVDVVFLPRVEGALDEPQLEDVALRHAELFRRPLAEHGERLALRKADAAQEDHLPSLPARRPLAQAHWRL